MNMNLDNDTQPVSNVRFARVDQYFKGLYYRNKRWFEARFLLTPADFQRLSQLLDELPFKVTSEIDTILIDAINRGKNEQK
jgi:hypothetical protein